MYKKAGFILAAVLLIMVLAVGCGGGTAKQAEKTEAPKPTSVIELRLHHHDPPTAVVARSVEAWAKRVESRAGGKLKITIYPGATLGSAKDTYEMIKSGTVDIGWGFTGFFPGIFPVSEGLSLPMLGITSTLQASEIIMDMYMNTDYLKNEYSKLKVLYLQGLTAAPIGTKKKEIKTLEDLKGLKLRCPGGPPTSFLKKVGGVPMNIASPELYTSLERGVVDGYVFDWTGIGAFRLEEQTSHILNANFSVGASWLCMNPEKWNSLPEDIKAAFDAESGMTGAKAVSVFWDEETEKLKATVFKGKVNNLSPEEEKRWKAVGREIAQEWIKEMDSKGYPGQAIYNKYLELVEKYKK